MTSVCVSLCTMIVILMMTRIVDVYYVLYQI